MRRTAAVTTLAAIWLGVAPSAHAAPSVRARDAAGNQRRVTRRVKIPRRR